MTETECKRIQTRTPSQNSAFIPDWANEFYKAKKIEGVSTATQTFYKQQLSHFLAFCEGQVIENLEQLTPNGIRGYLVWMEETGHNPGGVHAAYRVLKTFLRWYELEAEPESWRNPIAKIKAPRLAEDPLTPVEIGDVLKMAEKCDRDFLGWRDRAILLFLLDTGVRAGELLRMNQEDVNQTTGAVMVRIGKGRKPRAVFIGSTSRKVLRMYLRMRVDELPALWVTEDQSTRLKYGALRVVIGKHARAAKVKRPALHDFRRAFALAMLRSGIDLISLARLMGHTSTKVLARYLRLVTSDLQESHSKGGPVDKAVISRVRGWRKSENTQ